MSAIKIEAFSHCYDQFEAVTDFHMEVEAGDVYGFIGPNGAGKTTTLKFLATLLKPTRGQAWITGIDVVKEPYKIRKKIGFMPDHFGVYPGMTVEEFLDFFALAYGIRKTQRRKVIGDILCLLDLQGKRKALAGHLSRGMRQRLGLARTLLHDPPVLILDEPASGLDPRARIEIMELLKELRSMGKTVLVSSHVLSELADYCNRIGIIENGRMVAQGPLEEIIQKLQPEKRVAITLLGEWEAAQEALRNAPNVFHVQQEENTIYFRLRGEVSQIPEIVRGLLERNIPILWVKEVSLSLEKVFMILTKGVT